MPTFQKTSKPTLVPRFTEDTVLVTDSHRAYKTVANKYKIPLNQIPSGKHTSGGFHLGHINGYHHNIMVQTVKEVTLSA